MQKVNFFTAFDRFSDYVPILSTVTNLIDLFQKCVVIPLMNQQSVSSSHYYTYLNQKSFLRCVLLLVPVLGNIACGIYDFLQSDRKDVAPVQNKQVDLESSAKAQNISEVVPSHVSMETRQIIEEAQTHDSPKDTEETPKNEQEEASTTIQNKKEVLESSDKSGIVPSPDLMLGTGEIIEEAQISDSVKDAGEGSKDEQKAVSVTTQSKAEVLEESSGKEGIVSAGIQTYDPVAEKAKILEEVQKNGLALESATDFQNDLDIVLAAVQNNGKALKYAGIDCRNNEEIVLAAIKDNTGSSFYYASDSLKNNEKFLLKAVGINGLILSGLDVDSPFRGNPIIVLAAMKQNLSAFKSASEGLKKGKKFLLQVINDPEVDVLKFLKVLNEEKNKDWKEDRGIILAAVKRDSWALQYAVIEESTKGDLTKDWKIVEEALKKDGLTLQFVHEDLRKNRRMVDIAIKQNPEAIQFALLKDPKIQKKFQQPA